MKRGEKNVDIIFFENKIVKKHLNSKELIRDK